MQSWPRYGTMAVRGHTSLLNSLTGVKGPSVCAVRQNSKSDLVQGPVVLELEEGSIASLTTQRDWCLFLRVSNPFGLRFPAREQIRSRQGAEFALFASVHQEPAKRMRLSRSPWGKEGG